MIYRARFGYPGWRLRSPFEELDRLRRQMDGLMDFFSEKPSERMAAGVFPAVNLTEDPENYYIRAELPGVTAKDLNLEVNRNSLTIAGERRLEETGEKVRYHRRERESGKFSRAIEVPDEIDANRVAAKMVNGVLTITAPKTEKAKPRQITVQ